MKIRQWLSVWAVVQLMLYAPAQGLFEEQAGKNDWHLPMVGRISGAKLALRGRTRLFVASDEAVVACLDARTGALLWRQVLPPEDVVQQMDILQKPPAVVTWSRGSRRVRAWSSADGTLLWERSAGEARHMLVLPEADANTANRLALMLEGSIQALAGSSGRVLSNTPLRSDDYFAVVPAIHDQIPADATLFRVDSRRTEIELTHWRESGDPMPFTASFQRQMATFVPAGADSCAALSQDGQSVCILSNIAHSPTVACLALGKLSALRGELRLLQVDSPRAEGLAAIVSSEGGSAIVQAAAGSVKALVQHAGKSVPVGAVEISGEPVVGLIGSSSSGDVEGTLVSCISGAVLASVRVPWSGNSLTSSQPIHQAHVQYAVAGPAADLDALRVLLSSPDGALSLIEGQGMLWTQEQGLAAIEHAFFIDLPAPSRELAAIISSSAPTLQDRLKHEWIAIKERLGIAQPQDLEEAADISSKMNTRLWPSRDAEGFRKEILALSRYGKLLALHTGDGRALWSTWLGPSWQWQLLPWRSYLDVHKAPHVAVLRAVPGGIDLVILDAHTGDRISRSTVTLADEAQGFKVIPVGTRSHDGAYEQHEYILLGAEPYSGVAKLLPETTKSDKQTGQPARISFWTVNSKEGLLRGYQMMPGLTPDLTWTLSSEAENGDLLAVASKSESEPIYSHAKVLGDRSLKLKYLNPNVILVAIGAAEDMVNQAGSVLTILIVDTVTGRVLHRQTHQGARGPVHAVLCEHWAVYHFWSMAHHRYEMAVLELYDATPRDLSIGSMLFGNQNASSSAFSPPPVEVLTQSYLVKAGVRNLAATSSLRGISTKQIVMATDADQMYLMDKRFLDPRRPKGKPTLEDQAEMLPPFEPELPMVAEYVASHRRTVPRIKGFASSPAALESTALVIAYGLDLFMTVVQPSRTFDLIPDDFPYALLLAITMALATGMFVIRRVEQSMSTSKKWA